MNCGNVGQDPLNLPSIMSYYFQLAGVRANLICQGLMPKQANVLKNLDYSHGRMCSLDESQLNERFGEGLARVDWDCDNTISSVNVAHDLESAGGYDWCSASGGLQTLQDYDEWASIRDNAVTKSKMELKNMPTVSCITAEEWNSLKRIMNSCPDPPVSQEPCDAAFPYFVVPQFPITIGWGSCALPYLGLRQAHTWAPSGSTLFLKYGEYDEGVGPLTLDKPLTIFATDTVKIRVTGSN